jgi:hypothetical protein
MDYKELHQELYCEFEQENGREPTWEEMTDIFHNAIASMIDDAKDRAKYE